MTPGRLAEIERHAAVAGNVSASMADDLIDAYNALRAEMVAVNRYVTLWNDARPVVDAARSALIGEIAMPERFYGGGLSGGTLGRVVDAHRLEALDVALAKFDDLYPNLVSGSFATAEEAEG